MPGVDELQHLARRVRVADLRDHPRRRMHPAKMHQRLLEPPAPLVPRPRGRRRDLHRPRDRVLHRVLDGHHVELPVRLGHLEGQVRRERRGLAVPGRAAEEDPPVQGEADLGEHRRLRGREPQAFEGHPPLDAVAVEQPREQVVAVGLVRPALAAQRRDRGRQRHLAAGPHREPLERAPLVARLRRALVLAVEQEAHRLAALLRGHRLGERELAVVHDPVHAAQPPGGLEHHVARPRRRRVVEQPPDPARDRRLPAACRSRTSGPPARGDGLQRRGLLGQAPRHAPVPAQRQQRGPQAVVRLVARRDQAPPVRVHRADPPEARVHRAVAEQRPGGQLGVRGRRSPSPLEPSERQPLHAPSPAGRAP